MIAVCLPSSFLRRIRNEKEHSAFGAHRGWFDHDPAGAGDMKRDSMSKDSMSKDSMKKDDMKKDTMKKDEMKKDSMSKDDMKK
jgi:pentapeptide MXKDX repeat protein